MSPYHSYWKKLAWKARSQFLSNLRYIFGSLPSNVACLKKFILWKRQSSKSYFITENLRNEHMVIQVFRLENIPQFAFLDEFGVWNHEAFLTNQIETYIRNILYISMICEDIGFLFASHELGTNITIHWET